ncbi:curli assembly protein CsgF [Hymenobacter sp. BRD128]|uniref:curli production assembly/transport component CsgF n=1 Tax=Hymenobacter sp. BRD128 TaxID=2675878 RepID=UPI0015639025|nr:curli production assembly/transport component CsgF [Hymenobacter sp. BRD128]QKG57090.1 curli assembly protein CsgF [Hymenobacter sp. BRD128]
MKRFFTLALLVSLAAWAQPTRAQKFVYQPINPAFGGNTFNYTWLQASATAQNRIQAPTNATSATTDPLAQFSANLNQQVLSQLTSRLITSQFGQGAIKPGTYNVGAYQVQVSQSTGGVVITVTDTGTGNQTTITIPNGL